jgi:hypothetical protein
VPQKKKSSSTAARRKTGKQLSPRTKKQIDSLPVHAQHIYKEATDKVVKKILFSQDVALPTTYLDEVRFDPCSYNLA